MTSVGKSVRGLATLAMLKANFDAGTDHIEMFLPFVVDAMARQTRDDFSADDVRRFVESHHGLSIPHGVLKTILARAVKRGVARREGGLYIRSGQVKPLVDIASQRAAIEAEQERLGTALVEYARADGRVLGSSEDALALILEFVAGNHISLLLGASPIELPAQPLTGAETHLVARFIKDRCLESPSLRASVQRMLEGYVLQNTLLLRDISQARRRFSDLMVFLDTGLLFEAVGLVGEATALAAREGLQLLREAGARLAVFDRTLDEMKRILNVYVYKLSTPDGIASLYPTPLSRYVLQQHLSPAEMAEEIALLADHVRGLGILVQSFPPHDPRYTLDERKLGEILTKPGGSDLEPRVVHDVDCVAAVLTLRAGRCRASLDEACAVFATTTGLVVKNVTRWYEEQQSGGVPPVIHQYALTNIAWLKKPASASALKLRQLVALCSAATAPSRETWERFARYLNALVASGNLTTEEHVAIVASEIVDGLLSRFDEDIDADATTMAEVVDRVKQHYQQEAVAAAEKEKADLRTELLSVRDEASAAAARAQDEQAARAALERESSAKQAEANRLLELALYSGITRTARSASWVLISLAAFLAFLGATIPVVAGLWSLPKGWMALALIGALAVWGTSLGSLLNGGHMLRWRETIETSLEVAIRKRRRERWERAAQNRVS